MDDTEAAMEAQRVANEMANAMAWLINDTPAISDDDINDDSFLAELSQEDDSFSSSLPPPPQPPPPPPPPPTSPPAPAIHMDIPIDEENDENGSNSSRSTSERSESNRDNSHSRDIEGNSHSRDDSESQSRSAASSQPSSSSSSSSSTSSQSSLTSSSSEYSDGDGSNRTDNHSGSNKSNSTSNSRSTTGSRSEHYFDNLSNDDEGIHNMMDGNQTTTTSNSSGDVDKSLFSQEDDTGWSSGKGSSSSSSGSSNRSGHWEEDDFMENNHLDLQDNNEDDDDEDDAKGSGSGTDSRSPTSAGNVDDEESHSTEDKSYDDMEDGSEWISEDGDFESDNREQKNDTATESERKNKKSPSRSTVSQDDSSSSSSSRRKDAAGSPDAPAISDATMHFDDTDGALEAQQRANEMADALAWMKTSSIDENLPHDAGLGFGSVSFNDDTDEDDDAAFFFANSKKSLSTEIEAFPDDSFSPSFGSMGEHEAPQTPHTTHASFGPSAFEPSTIVSGASPLSQGPFADPSNIIVSQSTSPPATPMAESIASDNGSARRSISSRRSRVTSTSSASYRSSYRSRSSRGRKKQQNDPIHLETPISANAESSSFSGGANNMPLPFGSFGEAPVNSASTHGSDSRNTCLESRSPSLRKETVDTPLPLRSIGKKEDSHGSRDSLLSPCSKTSKSSPRAVSISDYLPPRPESRDSVVTGLLSKASTMRSTMSPRKSDEQSTAVSEAMSIVSPQPSKSSRSGSRRSGRIGSFATSSPKVRGGFGFPDDKDAGEPFSVDKSSSKSSLRSWHSKNTSKSPGSSSGLSFRSETRDFDASSLGRKGELQIFEVGTFGDDNVGGKALLVRKDSNELGASSHGSSLEERQASSPKRSASLTGESLHSLSFSKASISWSKKESGSVFSMSSAANSTDDPSASKRSSASVASASKATRKSSVGSNRSLSERSPSTGRSSSMSDGRERSAGSHSTFRSSPSRSGSKSYDKRPAAYSKGSLPSKVPSPVHSRSKSHLKQPLSRPTKIRSMSKPASKPRTDHRGSTKRRELRDHTTKLSETVSSILKVLEESGSDPSDTSISRHPQLVVESASAPVVTNRLKDSFYFGKSVSLLKEMDPGLDKSTSNIHVSIRNEGFRALVILAYEKLQEVRPRLKFLLSSAEWVHIHMLLLYNRVFDCELHFHRIDLPDQFQIAIPDDLPIFEPIASVLASIGIVEDESLGVTYIPVARPLTDKQYNPHDPDDVTEFLEWVQLDWNASWSKVDEERKNRRKHAKEQHMKIPEIQSTTGDDKLLEWEQLALEKWLGWDDDLWFSYRQACFAVNRVADFVTWPKDQETTGTHAWLLPREKNSDGGFFVRMPKPTLTPDTWMMALIADMSALPKENMATWYYKTNPSDTVDKVTDRFLSASISKSKTVIME